MVESAAEVGAETFGIDEALERFDDGHPDPRHRADRAAALERNRAARISRT